ncbi:hypothetical protein MRX96_042122 [Rhipicephalus microplus]
MLPAARSRGVGRDSLSCGNVFSHGLRRNHCLPQPPSRRGGVGLRCEGLHRHALGWSTAWLLAAEASLKEPTASSEAATWRFDRPAFGRQWLAFTRFFALASSLRVVMPRQSSIPKKSCSSALSLAGQEGFRLRGTSVECSD